MELNNDLKPRSDFPKIIMIHKFFSCWNNNNHGESLRDWLNVQLFDKLLYDRLDEELIKKSSILNIIMFPCAVCLNKNMEK